MSKKDWNKEVEKAIKGLREGKDLSGEVEGR